MPVGMAQDTKDDIPTTGGITGPQSDTKDATTPPDNPETDQGDVAKGEDKIGQAGAGH
jgi:hypothetical protein